MPKSNIRGISFITSDEFAPARIDSGKDYIHDAKLSRDVIRPTHQAYLAPPFKYEGRTDIFLGAYTTIHVSKLINTRKIDLDGRARDLRNGIYGPLYPVYATPTEYGGSALVYPLPLELFDLNELERRTKRYKTGDDDFSSWQLRVSNYMEFRVGRALMIIPDILSTFYDFSFTGNAEFGVTVPILTPEPDNRLISQALVVDEAMNWGIQFNKPIMEEE